MKRLTMFISIVVELHDDQPTSATMPAAAATAPPADSSLHACEQCGKPFQMLRSTKRFCTRGCKEAAKRDRQQAQGRAA